MAQLVPPIQEAFSKNRTYLYATNKYKKSGPMLYLIIHTPHLFPGTTNLFRKQELPTFQKR
jgi:hypothetical protein